MAMRSISKCVCSLVLTAAFAMVFCAGCAEHRVYDPYYHDYHVWADEGVYYNQWERETHRDHMDFNRRNEADKKAYWDWRHSHEH